MIELLQEHMWECLFKKYLGIPCFGCGFQRSVILLLQGHIVAAMSMYPPLLPQSSMLAFLALHVRLQFSHGAKVLTGLFVLTVLLMFINFVIKLNTGT